MGKNRELVRAYHTRFHPDQKEATPGTISPELLAFRRRLHDEEVREVTEAWDAVENWVGRHAQRSEALAHLVHELADVVIVAYGTASFLGIDLDDVIEVVMRASMGKIPNPDPAGKALKPPGFMPAAETIGAIVRALDAKPARCRHELEREQCDYCRTRPPEDPFSGPVRPAPARNRPGPVFLAAFQSECPGCMFNVETDDEARMLNGEAWHAGCATDEEHRLETAENLG